MLLKVLLENPSVFKNALKPSKIEATSRTALTLSYFILEMKRDLLKLNSGWALMLCSINFIPLDGAVSKFNLYLTR